MIDQKPQDVCPHCAMPVNFKQGSVGKWSGRFFGAGSGAYAASGITISSIAVLGVPLAAIIVSALGWYVGDNFGGDIDKINSTCPICERELGRADW